MNLNHVLRWATFCIVLFIISASLFAAEPTLMVNEDNDHYFKFDSKKMNVADLQAFVDQFANTKVTHLLFCPNGQRTSYRSAVHESIWDNIDRYEKPNIWSVNCKLLFDKGIDPYSVWIARCREKGIIPWLTMRMNDVHFVTTPNYFRNTDHWRTHPQWWCNPNAKGGAWRQFAYDYSHEEVRKYHLALVEELLDRYDIDGFEMDWMRFGYHLTMGKEKEKASFLTGFVRDVRLLVRKSELRRGHSITVGARVPTDPDEAAGLGMDAVGWAKSGYIDCLVVSPFFTATDHDISVTLWKDRLGTAADKVRIIPAIDHGSAPFPGGERIQNDPALLYGWANEMYGNGAESLYLFNWTYLPLDKPEYKAVLKDGLAPEVVLNKPRRHAIAFRDMTAPGKTPARQLPKTTKNPVELVISIGPKPTGLPQVNVILAFAPQKEVEKAVFEITLNGNKSIKSGELVNSAKYSSKAARVLTCEFAADSLRSGKNVIGIRQTTAPTQKIIWAEIETK